MAGRGPSLIDLVTADLPGHRREAHPSGRTRFIPLDGGPVLMVGVTERRRFLGREQNVRFSTSATARSTQPALLRLRHTGRLRREGIEVSVLEGDAEASMTAHRIEADPAFFEALVPLDFTRFEVRREKGRWTADVELMGAAMVSMALPPMRSYVRLYPDQRDALVDTLGRLMSLLEDPAQTAG